MTEPFLFAKYFSDPKGYEEVKKHLKRGNDFCKNLCSIMQERCDLEVLYAKTLYKIQQKLHEKTSYTMDGNQRFSFGISPSFQCHPKRTNKSNKSIKFDSSLMKAWLSAARLMENEALVHRQFSQALTENVLKPLSNLNESFLRNRRPIEATVEKLAKNLQDRREEEMKLKKKAFVACKEAEKMQQVTAENQSSSEKDVKVQKKCKSVCDGSVKADKEYYDAALRAERSRLEWHSGLLKGLKQLECLEMDRLNQLHEVMKKFYTHISCIGPAISMACDKFSEFYTSVDTLSDLKSFVSLNSLSESVPEQILFELPASDLSLSMNHVRRERCLLDYKSIVESSIQKERQIKEGCEKMIQTFKMRPDMSNETSEREAYENYNQILSLLNYYNAMAFRLQSSLDQLNGNSLSGRRQRLSSFMSTERDANRLPVTYLRVPLILSNNATAAAAASTTTISTTVTATATTNHCHGDVMINNRRTSTTSADTSSMSIKSNRAIPPVRPAAPPTGFSGSLVTQQQSIDNTRPSSVSAETTTKPKEDVYTVYYSSDEFTSDDELNDCHSSLSAQSPCQHSPSLSVQSNAPTCRALHPFQGRNSTELSFAAGDIITIFSKANSQWWHGGLHDKKGNFPADYVCEL